MDPTEPREEPQPEPRPFTLAQAQALWGVVASLAEATLYLDRARDGLLMIENDSGSSLAASSVDVLHHATRSLLHESGQALTRLRHSADPEVQRFVGLILHRLHASPEPADAAEDSA
jgi:hypothetical protein